MAVTEQLLVVLYYSCHASVKHLQLFQNSCCCWLSYITAAVTPLWNTCSCDKTAVGCLPLQLSHSSAMQLWQNTSWSYYFCHSCLNSCHYQCSIYPPSVSTSVTSVPPIPPLSQQLSLLVFHLSPLCLNWFHV